MVAYGENALWAAGEFFATVTQVATEQNWRQGGAYYTSVVKISVLRMLTQGNVV